MQFQNAEKQAKWEEFARDHPGEGQDDDDYRGPIRALVERWTESAEGLMTVGVGIDAAISWAFEAALQANPKGYSGAQVQCAVEAVVDIWAHGHAVQLWWNKRNAAPSDAPGTVDITALDIDTETGEARQVMVG